VWCLCGACGGISPPLGERGRNGTRLAAVREFVEHFRAIAAAAVVLGAPDRALATPRRSPTTAVMRRGVR
jgi:hypothetical protein